MLCGWAHTYIHANSLPCAASIQQLHFLCSLPHHTWSCLVTQMCTITLVTDVLLPLCWYRLFLCMSACVTSPKQPAHTRHNNYKMSQVQDQIHQRCFTQEPITALAASPNGAYIAAGGSSGSLYVWCAASGALLRGWPAHYKAVSCLAFTDTGGVLVSGGEDALVCAWLLAEVLDSHRDNPAAAAAAAIVTARVEPLHTW